MTDPLNHLRDILVSSERDFRVGGQQQRWRELCLFLFGSLSLANSRISLLTDGGQQGRGSWRGYSSKEYNSKVLGGGGKKAAFLGAYGKWRKNRCRSGSIVLYHTTLEGTIYSCCLVALYIYQD